MNLSNEPRRIIEVAEGLIGTVEKNISEGIESTSDRECRLCGAAEYTVAKDSALVRIQVYETECECGGLVDCINVEVVAGDEKIPVCSNKILEYGCDNCNRPYPPARDLVTGNEPVEQDLHEVYIRQPQTTNIHVHHLCYSPQITVDVCEECHAKIHNRDGFHDELAPIQNRSDYYE